MISQTKKAIKEYASVLFEFLYIVLASSILGCGLSVVITFIIALVFPSVWLAWKPFVLHLIGA